MSRSVQPEAAAELVNCMVVARILKEEENRLQNLIWEMFLLGTTYFAMYFVFRFVIFDLLSVFKCRLWFILPMYLMFFTIAIGCIFIIKIIKYFRMMEAIEKDWKRLLDEPYSYVSSMTVKRPKSDADKTVQRNFFVGLTIVLLSSLLIMFFLTSHKECH